MPPSSPAPAVTGRARTLLIVLAIVAVGAMVYGMWPAAVPTSSPSNERDARRPQQQGKSAARGSLDVRLDDLKQPPPEVGDAKRNPFRFYVPPPPPPPPAPRIPKPGDKDYVAPPPPPKPGDKNYVPPPPPPITIKFIGVLTLPEQGNKKVAIFSDCKAQPVYASEGQNVLGQYKLLKIGVESVTMSYLDGKGMQTIPMRGCQ